METAENQIRKHVANHMPDCHREGAWCIENRTLGDCGTDRFQGTCIIWNFRSNNAFDREGAIRPGVGGRHIDPESTGRGSSFEIDINPGITYGQ